MAILIEITTSQILIKTHEPLLLPTRGVYDLAGMDQHILNNNSY